jgi:hypothetical protein
MILAFGIIKLEAELGRSVFKNSPIKREKL